MSTGHYRAICKHRKKWFLFDDEVITEISEKQVLQTPGYNTFKIRYMCFYLRNNAEYIIPD